MAAATGPPARGATAVALLLALGVPASAQDGAVVPPGGAAPLFDVVADGVQIYACEARESGPAWVFRAPEANLFDASGRQVGTHGAGPHWRLADGSVTMGAGAIPWLLLRATPEATPGRLRDAAWIRRFDTEGGAAPGGRCDPGDAARMRYSARYTFFAR